MAVSIEQMRQTAASIVTHMHNDLHFKKQLRNDPQAALADAGLPARITYSITQEQRQNGFEAASTCVGSTERCLCLSVVV